MEKLFQIKTNFFKFLSKQPVDLVVAFQNPTLSPCRSPARVVSIIPKEARRKQRDESFGMREPTSPKVSCMGQVQGKKKRKARKHKRAQAQAHKSESVGEKKKIVIWIDKQKHKNKALEEKEVEAPTLSTMKKFASGRGSLCDFHLTVEER